MPPQDQSRRVVVRLSEDEHRRARLAAATRGVSLNEFGRSALQAKVHRLGVFDPECLLVTAHRVGTLCPECGGRGPGDDYTLPESFTTHCTPEELEHFRRFCAKAKLTLSSCSRLLWRNTTGLNDPPQIEVFGEQHLSHWRAQLTKLIRAQSKGEYAVLGAMVICHCCLFGQHLFLS